MLRYKTKSRPGLIALYDIRPGNGTGLFLQPQSPRGALAVLDKLEILQCYAVDTCTRHILLGSGTVDHTKTIPIQRIRQAILVAVCQTVQKCDLPKKCSVVSNLSGRIKLHLTTCLSVHLQNNSKSCRLILMKYF